jgi:hypothetical protein
VSTTSQMLRHQRFPRPGSTLSRVSHWSLLRAACQAFCLRPPSSQLGLRRHVRLGGGPNQSPELCLAEMVDSTVHDWTDFRSASFSGTLEILSNS